MAPIRKLIPKSAHNTPNAKAQASRLPALMLTIVVVLGVLVLLFAIGANYFGSKAKKVGSTEDRSIKQIIVGNDVLNIPANVFRDIKQRNSTTAKKLSLFYLWPGFEGYSAERHHLFYSTDRSTENLIFLTIEGKRMPYDMSSRLQKIYSTLLVGEKMPSVSGLVFQRLKPEAGYSGEELHYHPLEQPPYVVRCQRKSTGNIPAKCMRDFHIGQGLSISYRFSRNLLPHWRAIEETIRNITTGYLSN